MTNNNTSLLAAFGISMGFSADDMHDIVTGTMSALSNNETTDKRTPLDEIACVVAGMDTTTIWTGAMLYGYIIDVYKDIDVSAAIKD